MTPTPNSSEPLAFERIDWDQEGEPRSIRYGDIYRSSGTDRHGGLAQARHVFLKGCGLLGESSLWQNSPTWSILETGFGLGLNFLATWAQWRADPERPKRLHFVSIEAHPVAPQDLLKSAKHWPEIEGLANALSHQYTGLGPGFHHLSFEAGAVCLTLCIGDVQNMLPEIVGRFESIFLDGFNPERNPKMWETLTLKGVAAHAKPEAQLATWCVKKTVRESLRQVGFEVQKLPGLPPKRECLRANFSPHWQKNWRTHWSSNSPLGSSTGGSNDEVLIVGAGLMGASLARSLADRGSRVRVIDEHGPDAIPRPDVIKPLRAGANGLPLALYHPMNTRDDNLQSQMTRMGIRMLMSRIEHLNFNANAAVHQKLQVLEFKKPSKTKRSSDPSRAVKPSKKVTQGQSEAQAQELEDKSQPILTRESHLHELGGWMRPQAWIRTLLQHPNIELIEGFEVQAIQAKDPSKPRESWVVLGHKGQVLATQTLVLCAGYHSRELLKDLKGCALEDLSWPIQAIKGQMAQGFMTELNALIPESQASSWVLKGLRARVDQASFVAQIPELHSSEKGSRFFIGSTFERDQPHIENTPASQHQNLLDLCSVLDTEAQVCVPPQTLKATLSLEPWSGVRCTTPDRMPILDEVQSGLWVNFGLGSRGLSLCTLMAETLASLLHHEPLPLPKRLLKSICGKRFLHQHSTKNLNSGPFTPTK
jgi:tRNA 5-methylaminomethyl-2-thiouridine biosynthesis bifunctional protein